MLELILFGGFFLLLVIGAALDRRYNESPKWWILVLGIIMMTIWYWSELSFSGIWATIQSFDFWKPIGIYLAAGLVYSVFEFVISVRKLQRSHAESWNRFIAGEIRTFIFKDRKGVEHEVDRAWTIVKDGGRVVRVTEHEGLVGHNRNERSTDRFEPVEERVVTYLEIFRRAQRVGATDEEKREAEKLMAHYRAGDEYRTSNLHKDFIEVRFDAAYNIQPTINRSRLSSFVGAWALLWPAYAVSFLVGNFLVEVFRMVGDIFGNLGGRFVKLTFGNTFKL